MSNAPAPEVKPVDDLVDAEDENEVAANEKARALIRESIVRNRSDGWPFEEDLVCEAKILDEEPPNGPARREYANKSVVIGRKKWVTITRDQWNKLKNMRERQHGPCDFEFRRDQRTAAGLMMREPDIINHPANLAKAKKILKGENPETDDEDDDRSESKSSKKGKGKGGRPRGKPVIVSK